MIKIRYKSLEASFGVRKLEWTSKNKKLAKILNEYSPAEGDLSVGTP